MMSTIPLVNVWKNLSAARLAVFALGVGATLLCAGCTSVMNTSGDSKSGGWFAPDPPDRVETIEDFMKLKRMDP